MDQVVGIDDERHLGARLPDRDGQHGRPPVVAV
jgi:hypothetical protein